MTKMSVLAFVMSVAACGSSNSSSDDNPDPPPCPSGDCGKETFRRAVPTRAQVRIQHPTGARARRASHTSAPIKNPGQLALEPFSPALAAVDDEIVEIDAVVDEVFAELEATASTEPEIQTDTEHQWRVANPELSGHDDVLRITSTDEKTFAVEYFIVPTGASPESATPIVSGEVIAGDGDQRNFLLDVDLAAYSDVDPAYAATGVITIAVMPLAGGIDETWFDFEAVSFDGGPVETSRTTAWEYGDSDGALEYVADIDGAQATAYARWDARGGRYDHHAEFVDPDLGLVDEIVTNCWEPSGAETFDAFAYIDQNLDFYGELDGDEAACAFGPVEDHPSPAEDFENLPGDGEWQTLELISYCEVSDAC